MKLRGLHHRKPKRAVARSMVALRSVLDATSGVASVEGRSKPARKAVDSVGKYILLTYITTSSKSPVVDGLFIT